MKTNAIVSSAIFASYLGGGVQSFVSLGATPFRAGFNALTVPTDTPEHKFSLMPLEMKDSSDDILLHQINEREGCSSQLNRKESAGYKNGSPPPPHKESCIVRALVRPAQSQLEKSLSHSLITLIQGGETGDVNAFMLHAVNALFIGAALEQIEGCFGPLPPADEKNSGTDASCS